jgi:MoxR-like ATPase
MGFAGSDRYLASQALKMAVDAAIVLEKPLLIKGEPGTGKTVLAEAVAESLGAELISWHIKSTTKAQQGSTNTMPSPGCETPSSATPGSGR